VSELLAPARDEARGLEHLEERRLVHLLARLLETGHAAGHHERLRLCAGLGETSLHEENVEPLPHRSVG
jgi:hypothetical protein